MAMTWPTDQARPFRRLQNGQWETGSDDVAEEVAVAFVYNGVSHAVMMATPCDLVDFAHGFSLTENIVPSADNIYAVEAEKTEKGILLNIEISSACFEKLKEKRRNLTGRTGCGICGADSLQNAVRMPPLVDTSQTVSTKAIETAFDALKAKQPLHLKTGATHVAAWADAQGKILLVREDVGRHNALDKLVGALCGQTNADGFVVLSSRISYEMVQKTAVLGAAVIVAVSAPTGLAVDIAQQTGIALVRYNKKNVISVYSHHERIKEEAI